MEEKSKNQHLASLTEKELHAWLRFIRDSRWSKKRKFTLLKRYQQPSVIYDNLTEPEVCKTMSSHKLDQRWESALANDLDWLGRSQRHGLLTYAMANYPKTLRQLSDPPIALFYCGDAGLATTSQIAMVGSRRPTPLARSLAIDMAGQLSVAGICVTSGLAAGIDSLAHQGALNGIGGTLAVLGCGIDVVYPRSSAKLYQQIAEGHCLFSEYPPRTPPLRHHFPERNRIVAGLAIGTVIIEAAEKSGTMITARLAMESNKELMVVPGAARNPSYAGSHRLIQQGAALVCDAQDILICLADQLKFELQPIIEKRVSDELDQAYRRLLDHLHYGADMMVDELIDSSGLTSTQVSSMLLELELRGKVAVNIDGSYSRI